MLSMEYNTSIGHIFKMRLNSLSSYVKQNLLPFFMLAVESKSDRNAINIS